MKLNRLVEIMIILLNRRVVTAKELAGRFGVTVRTIYRDIEDLSIAGVPVYMTKGKGGGISLLEEYSISRAVLSERERGDLAIALKTMQAVKYPEIDSVLEKIGAVFKHTDKSDWVNIDFTGWGSSQAAQVKFEDIKDAIFRNNVISFDYVNAKGEKSSRSAEPEQLCFNRHTWYLLAFCLSKNEHRIFKLSRIKNLCVTGDTFERRSDLDDECEAIRGGDRPTVELHLRFSDKMLPVIYDNFEEDCVVNNDDGSYDVYAVFPEDEWVYGFILSFGHHVKVISPPHIRDIISGSMKKALSYYL